MSEVLLLAVVAGGFGLLALILLLVAIKRRSMKALYACLISVLLAILAGAWAGYLGIVGAYSKWEEKDIKNPLSPRSGDEIYAALFGLPQDTCVQVLNSMDQIMPKLDCCIWLEFQTCPQELRRVIRQHPFKELDALSHLDSSNLPNYTPRPGWFDPRKLGKGYKILQREYDPEGPISDLILYFSADSTRALYCDMKD